MIIRLQLAQRELASTTAADSRGCCSQDAQGSRTYMHVSRHFLAYSNHHKRRTTSKYIACPFTDTNSATKTSLGVTAWWLNVPYALCPSLALPLFLVRRSLRWQYCPENCAKFLAVMFSPATGKPVRLRYYVHQSWRLF